MRAKRKPDVLAAMLALLLAGAPAAALGHPPEEEAEIHLLAKQPARVLAQQAIAELEVRGERHEAEVRLDAALESKDKSEIDVKLLEEATETLDGGDPEGAVLLLDEALSRPLGAASGKALHESGREFEPAKSAQEVVGIVVGAVLLALGLLGLAAARRRARPRTAGT